MFWKVKLNSISLFKNAFTSGGNTDMMEKYGKYTGRPLILSSKLPLPNFLL